MDERKERCARCGRMRLGVKYHPAKLCRSCRKKILSPSQIKNGGRF